MNPGETKNDMSGEKRQIFRALAIEVLQRAQDRPIEQESWALTYLEQMINEVFYEKERLKEAYEIEKKVKQSAQGLMGRMFAGIGGYFDNKELIELNDKFQEKLQVIDQKMQAIRGRYQVKSRSYESRKISEANIDKIPGAYKIPFAEKNDFIKKMAQDEYHRLESIEKETINSHADESEKHHHEVIDYIHDVFFKAHQENIQTELAAIQGLETIDPEIRLGLIAGFRKAYVNKVIMEESSDWTNEPGAEPLPASILDAQNTLNNQRQKMQAAIYSAKAQDYQTLTAQAKISHIAKVSEAYEDWTKKAFEKFAKINGSRLLLPVEKEKHLEAMIRVEEQFSIYEKKGEAIGLLQKMADYIFDTEFGAGPYGQICLQEWQNKKAIENAVYEYYRSKTTAKLQSQLALHQGLERLPLALRSALEKDLQNAIVNEEMIADGFAGKNDYTAKFIGSEIRIAVEFADVPDFYLSQNINQIRAKLKTITATVVALRETRNLLQTAKGEAIVQYNAKEKELTNSLKDTIGNVARHDFSEKDQEFQVGGLQGFWKQTKKTLLDYFKKPEVQSAFVMADLLGGAVGTVLPLFGTASGVLIGSAIGYNYAQASKLLSPLKYLISEIGYIFNKPKSYIDRAFRASTILGVLAVATYGLVLGALAIGLTNPFSAFALLGIAVVAAAGSAAAAASKWISKKISETVYGIYNSDRYELSSEAKKFFSIETANKIRAFFVKEIIATQKKIEKMSDKSTHEGIVLSRKLYELEATWDKIQLGNEGSVKAWTECAKNLYLVKRDEYNTSLGHQVEDHKQGIVGSLLDIAEPVSMDSRLKEPGETTPVKATKKPLKKNLLTFLHKVGSATKKVMAEINEIEVLNKVIFKPK